MNGWIFIEIVIAGFFLWTVIDPVYVLSVAVLQDKGYTEKGRYVMQMGAYGSGHGLRDTTVTKEERRKAYLRFVQTLGEQPEVDAAYIALYGSLPNALSWNGGQFYPDTASVSLDDAYTHAQQYFVLAQDGCNMFRTLGIKDANSGEVFRMPADAAARHLCFVSECFAKQMFGGTEVVGQKVYVNKERSFEIGGVFKDLQTRDFMAPYPLIIFLHNELPVNGYMHTTQLIVFSLKDGVDFDRFNERFTKEVAPHLSQSNFYFDYFKPFADLRKELGTMAGVYNTFRLKLGLAAFTLLCIFLGMVGTFWIRCNARRQEIGLMRSVGASEGRIRRQFLTEAGILVTAAFVLSLVLVVNLVVMAEGMTQPQVTGERSAAFISEWLQPGTQFAVVSIVTYVALLVIALIGTLVPVKRAAKVLPAEALRDE